MDSGLVGLHMNGMLAGPPSTTSGKKLPLGGADAPWQ